jgi:hypothetical protein
MAAVALTALSVGLSAAPAAADAVTQPVVRRVDLTIDGPGWTRPGLAKRGLDTRVGEAWDRAVLDNDLRRMRNYEIYQAVTATVTETVDGVDVHIDATDRWALIPLFRPRLGGGIINVWGGIRDLNFLGYNQEFAAYGGYYRSPRSQSWLAGAWLIQRQFLGRHYLYTWAQRDYMTEPFYEGTTAPVTALETEVFDVTADFLWQQWDRVRPGFWIYGAERTYRLLEGVDLPERYPERIRGLRGGLQVKLGRIDYDRFRYKGGELHAGVFHEFRPEGEGAFSGGFVTGRLFLIPHDRINLAFRGQAELRNNAFRVDDIAWGGFDTVRGFPDRWLKGNRAGLLNHEVRVVAADQALGFGFLQFAAFYDVGWVDRGPLPGPRGLAAQAIGGGIRVGVVQINGTFARIDVAYPFSHPDLGPDISLGAAAQFY